MISVVVPIFNEEESVKDFYQELIKNLKKIQEGFEIVFVDDGSTDETLTLLKNLKKKENVRIFSFRRNQGKAEALTLGFQKAIGDYIVTLDADLQDKPSEIKKLLDKKREGYDVVCGWRKHRQDPFAKVLSSKIFNFLAGLFWGLNIHDYNCGLKVFSKESVESLELYGGLHRFIPLIMYQRGFSVGEVAIEHRNRIHGRSKYGFSKLWKDLPDIFTMLFLSKYSSRPMHFFGLIGGIFIFIGLVILVYLTVIHFAGQAIGRRPLLFLGMLLVIGGLQVFFTGFLADLILHTLGNNKTFKAEDSHTLKYSTD